VLKVMIIVAVRLIWCLFCPVEVPCSDQVVLGQQVSNYTLY